MSVFVADLGGTWLRTAVYAPETRSLSQLSTWPTPDNPAACRAEIEAAWFAARRPRHVGIAAAPTLGGDGLVRGWGNRPDYVGHALLAPCMAATARVIDDGTAAAVAAHAAWDAGESIVLAVTVGTGIGGGAVIAGKPLVGARASAMEVGHIRVPPASGHTCACGAEGCVQAVASGRAIAAALAAGCSEEGVLDRAAEAIRALVAILVTAFDPHRIALSGGLGLGALRSRLIADGSTMSLELHPCGEEAGLVGAGLIASSD